MTVRETTVLFHNKISCYIGLISLLGLRKMGGAFQGSLLIEHTEPVMQFLKAWGRSPEDF